MLTTMRSFFIVTFVLFGSVIGAQTNPTAVSVSPMAKGDSLLKSSLDTFAEAAECWTPEQKKEFADVFFIERGKFTIPKEPIVLKSFDTH